MEAQDVVTVPNRRRFIAEAVVVVVAVVVAVWLSLWLGGDRLVPCDERRGLDSLLIGQGGHVDGPEGGGGCIVPTAGAWMAAVVGATLPLLVWAASVAARLRRHTT